MAKDMGVYNKELCATCPCVIQKMYTGLVVEQRTMLKVYQSVKTVAKEAKCYLVFFQSDWTRKMALR